MINLSYIFSTRNRLPFLKVTLERLLSEVEVVDGNSTDGTKEYLQKLYETGKIQQYISEPDRNQAHAWNKAMLLAKGEIIKKIIDDDVFCYPAIRECKKYMLANNEVDVCISNDLTNNLTNYKNMEKHSKQEEYLSWKRGEIESFSFRDVHILIRRKALSLIGLYYTNFVNMDWEYSLRISYLKANIIFYTGYNSITVAHPNTVTSLRDEKLIRFQGKLREKIYNYPGDHAHISWWSHIKIFVGKSIKNLKKNPSKKLTDSNSEDFLACYNYSYEYINDLHQNENSIFLS